MENLEKHWELLESLKFPVNAELQTITNETNRLEYNILKLEAIIKTPPSSFIKHVIEKWQLDNLLQCDDSTLLLDDILIKYSLYSLYLLNEIIQQVNFQSSAKEDLISERHKLLLISCLQDIGHWGLEQNLYKDFYQGKPALFRKETKVPSNYFSLELLIQGCTPAISIQQLHIGAALDEIILQYMAGIFSLVIIHETKEYVMSNETCAIINTHLKNIWIKLSKTQFIRNVMLIRSSNNNMSKVAQNILQRQLLLRLWSPGGFQALMFALNDANKNEEKNMNELVAHLVAQSAYPAKAQESLLQQILTYIQASLTNETLKNHMGAALLSLRRLFDLNANNRSYVAVWLNKQLQPLVKPQQNDLEIMEWSNFLHVISIIYHSFCISSVECLPSYLLTNHLCLLLKLLHNTLPYDNVNILQDHLKSIIIRCLDNRLDSELETILESFIFKEYSTNWSELHERVIFTENILNGQELKIILCSTDSIEPWEPITVLVEVLRTSTFNLLTYKVFLIIFRLLPKIFEKHQSSSTDTSSSALLLTEEDIVTAVTNNINRKYDAMIQVVNILEILVQHPPMKMLIYDNPKELFTCLISCLNSITVQQKCYCSSTVIILLILIKEVIENFSHKVEEFYSNLVEPLTKLQTISEDHNIILQISSIIKILQSKNNFINSDNRSLKTGFEKARSLMESKESYLQVEGIENLIKLIKLRDENTLSNGPIIMALALTQLKSQESYTFLNCVRLFAALVHVMETEVLHILSDEYLNNLSPMDYRLVVGEAILKTCRELGPLCYKYKGILLNCFLNGCRSNLDEFRFSSYSNLGQLCRILTYQVDQFFQEMLHMIDCELSTGQYLPAKRASVMVLSDLLDGMDNLIDHQHLLLPVYRLLKHLAFLPNVDEKIRMHAINGLSCLSEKCKQLFQTISEPSLNKEIKIVSIKDSPKIQGKKHILELN